MTSKLSSPQGYDPTPKAVGTAEQVEALRKASRHLSPVQERTHILYERYKAGERVPALAKEIGMTYDALQKRFRKEGYQYPYIAPVVKQTAKIEGVEAAPVAPPKAQTAKATKPKATKAAIPENVEIPHLGHLPYNERRVWIRENLAVVRGLVETYRRADVAKRLGVTTGMITHELGNG